MQLNPNRSLAGLTLFAESHFSRTDSHSIPDFLILISIYNANIVTNVTPPDVRTRCDHHFIGEHARRPIYSSGLFELDRNSRILPRHRSGQAHFGFGHHRGKEMAQHKATSFYGNTSPGNRPVCLLSSAARPGLAALESTPEKNLRLSNSCE